MSRKKSIKEIKAELSANKHKLDEINHPNRKHFHSNLKKNRLSKELQKIDEQRKEELNQIEQEDNFDDEQDYQEQEREQEKVHTKHVINNSFAEILRSQNQDLKRKIKKKKKSKSTMIIASIVLPILLLIILLFLTIWLFLMGNLDDDAAIIAGLSDPKERAMLQAENELGDSSLTNIPSSLLGNSGSSSNSSKSSSGSKSDDTNVTVSGNDKTELGRAKIVTDFIHKATQLNAVQIAAILGNFDHESAGIYPNRVQGDYTRPPNTELFAAKIKNPTGLGVGLGQWSSGRAYNLASAAGHDPKKAGSMQWQLNFWLKEAKAHYQGVIGKGAWMSRTDVNSATDTYEEKWEVAGNPDLSDRESYARKMLPYVKKWIGES